MAGPLIGLAAKRIGAGGAAAAARVGATQPVVVTTRFGKITLRLDQAKLQAHMERLASRAMEDFKRRAIANARQLAQARLQRRTGQYLDGLTTDAINPMGGFEFKSGAPHGRFIEFGTRPHWIVPRRKQALAFNVGMRRVIVRRVWHPGTKPQRILQDAAVQAGQQSPFVTTGARLGRLIQ